MLFLILSLLLNESPARSAPPASRPKSPAVSLISLCGPYDPVSRSLTILPNTKVILAPDSAMEEKAGTYCIRGKSLLGGGGRDWIFTAQGFWPAPEGLKFPVLICASLSPELRTLWNNDELEFRGPVPELHSPHGWCGDGTALPRREGNRWVIDFDRFREAPDPWKRSGMSIGNQ